MTNEVQQCDREVADQSARHIGLTADWIGLGYTEGDNDWQIEVQAARLSRIRMEREVVQPLRDELAQAGEREKALQERVAELDATIKAAYAFLVAEYRDVRAEALEGEPYVKEARPIISRLADEMAQALAGDHNNGK